MFNFFDNEKNPFMYMMNMDHPESEATPVQDFADTSLMQMMQQFSMMQMQMMQQTLMTHMQMAQMMCVMPMQFMRDILGRMEMSTGSAADSARLGESGSGEQQSGFKLGNMEIPSELLGRLMQMDMSPENLEKLQKLLDFVFDAIPQPKDESTIKEEGR